MHHNLETPRQSRPACDGQKSVHITIGSMTGQIGKQWYANAWNVFLAVIAVVVVLKLSIRISFKVIADIHFILLNTKNN